jgi:hypothetical protein
MSKHYSLPLSVSISILYSLPSHSTVSLGLSQEVYRIQVLSILFRWEGSSNLGN